MDHLEKRKQIEQALLKKDMAKLITFINEGIPLSELYIKNKTDILLESIVNKKIIIFINLLNAGFDIINGEFLYLHHSVRTKEIRYVNELVNKVKDNLEYLNKKDLATGDNALHIAMSQKVDSPIILELSKAGVNWNAQNKNGQTPIHLLLREYLLIDQILINELINKKANFGIKDNMGISPLDIINSFKLNTEWKNLEQTQYLLQKLDKIK